MSKIACTRRFQFCAGHRVLGHENKCGNLHGHNYVVHVTAEATAYPTGDGHMDHLGRVIDFSVIKEKLGRWLEELWDHGFILFDADKGALAALSVMSEHMTITEDRAPQKLFLMPYNPTAENMAKYLVTTVCPRLFADTVVIITKCVIEETENCSASYEL